MCTAVSILETQVGARRFNDIEVTFNNTSRATIEAALRRYEFPRKVRNSVNDMLAVRTDTASKTETEIRGRVISGYQWGGVPSPLLWNLVVDKLLNDMEGQGCKEVDCAVTERIVCAIET